MKEENKKYIEILNNILAEVKNKLYDEAKEKNDKLTLEEFELSYADIDNVHKKEVFDKVIIDIMTKSVLKGELTSKDIDIYIFLQAHYTFDKPITYKKTHTVLFINIIRFLLHYLANYVFVFIAFAFTYYFISVNEIYLLFIYPLLPATFAAVYDVLEREITIILKYRWFLWAFRLFAFMFIITFNAIIQIYSTIFAWVLFYLVYRIYNYYFNRLIHSVIWIY